MNAERTSRAKRPHESAWSSHVVNAMKVQDLRSREKTWPCRASFFSALLLCVATTRATRVVAMRADSPELLRDKQGMTCGDECQSEFVACAATAFDVASAGALLDKRDFLGDISVAVLAAEGLEAVLQRTLDAWHFRVEENKRQLLLPAVLDDVQIIALMTDVVTSFVQGCAREYEDCEAALLR